MAEEMIAVGSGHRRLEDIALDLMKFIAMTASVGKPTAAAGFQPRPEKSETSLIRCCNSMIAAALRWKAASSSGHSDSRRHRPEAGKVRARSRLGRDPGDALADGRASDGTAVVYRKAAGHTTSVSFGGEPEGIGKRVIPLPRNRPAQHESANNTTNGAASRPGNGRPTALAGLPASPKAG